MLEIEPMNSVFEDWALCLVLSLCGQECKDMLLYEGDPYYRLIGITPSDVVGRPELGQRDSDCTSNYQDQGQSA
ncbi:hypothetical protein PAECIP111893_02371 [Paenibacillus plantiphilus]|uniref:Uncharacterized protein n=1 Tax=Paenibacillus plantiphilus TaxID=2905650 RepID=A0ABM9C9P5_9BACL|nr:hypothetical protein PAECIP111893_02371 [Paenibacillus plantiphilus]